MPVLPIKDCPFCGTDERRLAFTEVSVKCRVCGATGPTATSLPEALDIWNERAHDEIPT